MVEEATLEEEQSSSLVQEVVWVEQELPFLPVVAE